MPKKSESRIESKWTEKQFWQEKQFCYKYCVYIHIHSPVIKHSNRKSPINGVFFLKNHIAHSAAVSLLAPSAPFAPSAAPKLIPHVFQRGPRQLSLLPILATLLSQTVTIVCW